MYTIDKDELHLSKEKVISPSIKDSSNLKYNHSLLTA